MDTYGVDDVVNFIKLVILGKRYTCMCMPVQCTCSLHYFIGMNL